MASSETFDTAVRRAARRAYERGRAEGALMRGAVAAVLAMPGLFLCHPNPAAPLCLAGFALVVAAGRFRGGAYEEGTRAGALAGIAPCLLPAAIQAAGGNACAVAFAGIPWPCAVGGVAAGVILGFTSRMGRGLPFWASALVALGLGASLGCLPAGAAGFGALVLGVFAGGVPALAVRRAFA